MEYKSEIVQALFNITGQTVRNWSSEFGSFLSEHAVGGDNKHRVFTEGDLTVFALISELKAKRMSTDDIHATLATGNRGELPDNITTGIVPVDTAIKISRLESEVSHYKHNYEHALSEIEQLKLEKARLEGELTSLSTVRQQLSDEHEKRDKLMREIGELEARLEFEREMQEKRDDYNVPQKVDHKLSSEI